MVSVNQTEIKRHLDAMGVNPSKKLGQNFLIDENVARWIVDQLDVQAGDTVVEVMAEGVVVTEEGDMVTKEEVGATVEVAANKEVVEGMETKVEKEVMVEEGVMEEEVEGGLGGGVEVGLEEVEVEEIVGAEKQMSVHLEMIKLFV